MSLKAFHILFIIVATLLCVLMGVWGWNDYFTSGDKIGFLLGIVGTAGLLLLIPYYTWFRKKAQTLGKAAIAFVIPCFVFLAHPHAAHACSACFGDPSSPMTKGLKVGILTLLGVTGSVLAGIASIGITWARRAKAIEDLSS